MPDTIERLASDLLIALRRRVGVFRSRHRADGERDEHRFVLGVTGIPGSGKSTVARQLLEQINRSMPDFAAVVGMDGYHLPNAVLEQRGLRLQKGSPGTFDVPGFVDLLQRLRQSPRRSVSAPAYDRRVHEPVAGAVIIDADTRLVIVEGNYLLLTDEPWLQVQPLLDEVWYLDTPLELAMGRVADRHRTGGKDAALTEQMIAGNDRPSADIVTATRDSADRIIRLDQ